MKRLAMVLALLGLFATAGSTFADCGNCPGKNDNRIEEPQQ